MRQLLKKLSQPEGLAVVAAVMTTVLFFSAPLIVTFDSSHYLSFLPILRGQTPLEEWDVFRGPGFPSWLLLLTFLFGNGVGGSLIASMLCLVVTVAAMGATLRAGVSVWKPSLLGAGVVVALDPTSFGYFHSLLTEYLAATLFAIGVGLAALRMRRWESQGTLNLPVELLAMPLSAFAYYVKQPYVAAFLFPAILSALWAVRRPSLRLQAMVPPVLTAVAVGLAVVAWAKILPSSGNAAVGDRKAGALLANNLASTCLRSATRLFGDTESNVVVCPDPSWRDQPAAKTYHLESACDDGQLSTAEALKICGRSVLEKPAGLLIEVSRGLLELYTIGEARGHHGTAREHVVIPHRVFRVGPGVDAVFWLPEGMRAWAAPYNQTGQQTGALVRLLGRLAPLSVRVHSALGLLIVALAIGSAVRFAKKGAAASLGQGILFVAANTSAMYSVSLAVLGTTIDRYQYPVFPVSLVTIATAIALWRAPLRAASGSQTVTGVAGSSHGDAGDQQSTQS